MSNTLSLFVSRADLARLATAGRACAVLGVTKPRLLRMIDRGDIAAVRTPYGALFHEADIVEAADKLQGKRKRS